MSFGFSAFLVWKNSLNCDAQQLLQQEESDQSLLCRPNSDNRHTDRVLMNAFYFYKNGLSYLKITIIICTKWLGKLEYDMTFKKENQMIKMGANYKTHLIIISIHFCAFVRTLDIKFMSQFIVQIISVK